MIVLLTYDAPHRKTQDVAWRMLAAGRKFRVIAVPWEERKPRRFLYAHRPAEMGWPCEPIGDPVPFFEAFDVDYQVCSKGWLFEVLLGIDPELIVVGGAGIIQDCIVKGFDVLNVHPGFIPQCRGLDALKWAIVEGKEVGVTAHICDEYADLGWRICEAAVPVFQSDTFHSFAMRQYEMELSLINKAIDALRGKTRESFTRVLDWGTTATRRMKRSTEAGLLEAFDAYKAKHVKELVA
jgi:phosphoribosylglycinamide formyltransferase-1